MSRSPNEFGKPHTFGPSEIVPPPSRLSFLSVTSSTQIPGSKPFGGVIPAIAPISLLPLLNPDSSSSRASSSRFLNAFKRP